MLIDDQWWCHGAAERPAVVADKQSDRLIWVTHSSIIHTQTSAEAHSFQQNLHNPITTAAPDIKHDKEQTGCNRRRKIAEGMALLVKIMCSTCGTVSEYMRRRRPQSLTGAAVRLQDRHLSHNTVAIGVALINGLLSLASCG